MLELSKILSQKIPLKTHGLCEFTAGFDMVKLQENKVIFQLNLFYLSCHFTIVHVSLNQNVGTTLLFIFMVGIFNIDTMAITMFISVISVIFPLRNRKN